MVVEKKIINDDDGSVGYIESTYDSTNILKTIYFPKQNKLYISFSRGGTYSYENIDNDLFEEFQNAESQGKFFYKHIRDKDNIPFKKEFTLYPSEIEEINESIKSKKEENED